MSPDCDEALAQLYVYLDSELHDASSEEIRTHLDNCPECCQSFEFEIRLKRVVRERLNEEVPESLVDRIRQALHHESSGAT